MSALTFSPHLNIALVGIALSDVPVFVCSKLARNRRGKIRVQGEGEDKKRKSALSAPILEMLRVF